MAKTPLFLLAALFAGLSLVPAACGPLPTTGVSPVPTPPREAVPTEAPVTPGQWEETPSDPQVASLVRDAKHDLSGRLGLPQEQIILRSIESVRWRDSSLGCPKPGMNYLMVITPGYLIRLEAGGQSYEYHASQTQVVFCDAPQPPLGQEEMP